MSEQEEARKALADSRRSSRETDSVVNDAGAVLAQLRAIQPDHLADRLREIIRGAA